MKGNKKILKTIGLVVIALLVALLLTGCPDLMGFLEEDEDDDGGGTSDTYRAATSNLESDLADAGLTQAQIDAITESAVGSLTEAELTGSDDPEAVLTTMVGGSQRALNDSSFDDDDRLAAIEAIVGSAVGSVGDSSVSRRIRASQTSDIVGAIVTVSVSGIGDAGFSADASRRQAAGSSTGGAVRNLGRGGITSDTASLTVGRIAQSATLALGDGGYAAADVGDTARYLTRQTLANVDDTGIAGLDIDLELRNFGREVSRGVTSNLGRSGVVTATNSGEAIRGVTRGSTGALSDITIRDAAQVVNDLTTEVSRGASESLADLQADVTDLDIQASVRIVVRGTTEGLNDFSVDRPDFASAITTDTFSNLVRSASTGARRADSTISEEDLVRELGEEIDALTNEITALQERLEALETEIATLVSEGVAAADNEAPTGTISVTASGSSLTSGANVDTGTTVSITGAGSDAAGDDSADGGYLQVTLSLVGPNGNNLDTDRVTELENTNTLSTSFDYTLTVPGAHRVTLTVSDGIESVVESFRIEVESNLAAGDKDALMVRGISYLEAGYVNDALNDFRSLYESDSDYVPGALAYSLVDMATILTDTEVVSFARNTLGLTDYPTRVADILNFEYWMSSVYDPASESFVLFPSVANQEDLNDDGVVDPGERLTQMVRNMIAAEATNNTAADLFAGKFGEKLDALQTRVGGIDASGGFTITPTMVFRTEAEAELEGWPPAEDESGDLLEITIGTAELNVILATGRLVQFFNQWGQAIDLAVNYDYYLFDDDDKFRIIFDPPDSETELTPSDIYNFPALGPLAENNFLNSRSDAEAHLAAAGDAFVTMLDTVAGAMEDIVSRTADGPFSLSPDMVEPFLEGEVSDPSAFLDDVATVFRNLADDVTASFNAEGGTPAYLPVPGLTMDGPEEFFSTYADSWPTSTTGVNTDGILAFDFGILFSTSIGGIAGVFELDSTTREPVLYKYSNPESVVGIDDEEATVEQLENAAKSAGFTKAAGDWFNGAVNDATNIYFARVPDATLGMAPGALTQADLDEFNIDVNVRLDDYYDSELGYYVEYEYFRGHDVFARFDPVENTKVEMFIRVPAVLAGHLATPKDTEFTVYEYALYPDEDTNTFTSLGSFWWGILTDIEFSDENYYYDDEPIYEEPVVEGEYVGGESAATAADIPADAYVELTALAGSRLWYRVPVQAGMDYYVDLDDWDGTGGYGTDVYYEAFRSNGLTSYFGSQDYGGYSITVPADETELYIVIDGTEWNESGPVGFSIFQSELLMME